jgi:hypothetical protein
MSASVPATVERPTVPMPQRPEPPGALLPRFTFDEMRAMAEDVARSGLFAGISTPQQALTLMMLCDAEGLHPMQAIKRYHIIKNRPSMRADAMQAEFQRQGGVVRWAHSDATRCVAEFTHDRQAPDGVRVEWTLERAQKAGLLGNDNWKKYPEAMLRARTISEGVRMVLPGVVAGIYTPEEVADFDDPKPRREPVRPTPAPKPVSQNAKSEEEPRKPAADEADRWSDFVGKALAYWAKRDPHDAKESESRRERLLNALASRAIAGKGFGYEDISRPNKEGKLVRDRGLRDAELRALYAAGAGWPEWLRDEARAYIDEKCQAKPAPAPAPLPAGVPELTDFSDDGLGRWQEAASDATGLDVARILGEVGGYLGYGDAGWSEAQCRKAYERALDTIRTQLAAIHRDEGLDEALAN